MKAKINHSRTEGGGQGGARSQGDGYTGRYDTRATSYLSKIGGRRVLSGSQKPFFTGNITQKQAQEKSITGIPADSSLVLPCTYLLTICELPCTYLLITCEKPWKKSEQRTFQATGALTSPRGLQGEGFPLCQREYTNQGECHA